MKVEEVIYNDSLADFHIPRWEELPDIDLYLEQEIVK